MATPPYQVQIDEGVQTVPRDQFEFLSWDFCPNRIYIMRELETPS